MERVQELQQKMRAVEPPVVLMKGLKKFLREKRAGQKVDLYEDLEVREVIREELLKQEPSANEVYPNLFVGNGKSVKDIHYLKNLGITHIVNMAENDTLSPIKVNQEEYKTQGGLHILIDKPNFTFISTPGLLNIQSIHQDRIKTFFSK